MLKKVLCTTSLSVVALALTGCSQFGLNWTNDKVQYESSTSRAPLDIPPDLNAIPTTDRYTVPSRPQIVSANAEAAKMRLDAQARGETVSKVLPQTRIAKVVRDGSTRYVHVTESADRVWPILQDFWPSVGLTVKAQDAKSGVIQTEWAENKANLPQDIIRGTIGKILDFAYDTGERDQYRMRLERNDDGSCNIYITHRSMVEVLRGKQQDGTVWQPGPSDPELEAEMLVRLSQKIESEFNPDIKPEEQKAMDELTAVKYAPKSRIVNDDAGEAVAVMIDEPFDRAWRRVNVGLDRSGFDIVDRDRSQGIIMVKYLDADYEAKMKKEQGFFTNVFSRTRPVPPAEYRIRVVGEAQGTRVTVTGPDGHADTTGVSPKIVTLIGEQTR